MPGLRRANQTGAVMAGDIRDKIFGLSGSARETMRCLFFHGPTWDGDLPSKSGRSELIERGFAERGHGFNWLNAKGVEFGIKSLMLDQQKDKWRRERRRAMR